MSEHKYNIESSDKIVIAISPEALELGGTLTGLVGNLRLTPEDIAAHPPIPVPNVDGETLRLIVEWSEHHKHDPPTDPAADPNPSVPEWDLQFFEESATNGPNTLYTLIMAANYLDIPKLVDSACKACGQMMRGKSDRELCDFFGLDDYKKEEPVETFSSEKSTSPGPQLCYDDEAGPSTSK